VLLYHGVQATVVDKDEAMRVKVKRWIGRGGVRKANSSKA
jgi:hypothetical protein